MQPSFKELTTYFIGLGAAEIGHSHKTYLAHAIGVYNDMKAMGGTDALCRAALFHSIYGTQGFQGFILPIERQAELRELIGDHAEKIAYLNCFMDRESFDATLTQLAEFDTIIHRETREALVLSKTDYADLVCIHLCDWLEQVRRDQRWDHRRDAYRKMAEYLGGSALASYDRVFAFEPMGQNRNGAD